jgi:uncharacterized protein YndB with AHSA1/START domain
MTAGASSPTTAEGQVRLEREVDAPLELVWRAWTEPDQFMRWYGPMGLTTYRCEIDLQVGGRRSIGMRWPDGREYNTTGVFLEVEPPERFVATESPAGGEGSPETVVTLTLEPMADGRTKLTVSQAGFPNEDWAVGAGRGWNEALDKLAAVLGGSVGP